MQSVSDIILQLADLESCYTQVIGEGAAHLLMASAPDLLGSTTVSSYPEPSAPRALRILQLPDRLVLHDVTYALRSGKSATDRNALVDAVNQVHSRVVKGSFGNSPVNSGDLIDLSPAPRVSRPADFRTPTSLDRHRYLVFPFTTSLLSRTTAEAAFEALSPQEAGIQGDTNVLSVEAAAGFLGLLRLHAGIYCVVASNIKKSGVLPSGDVLVVTRVKLFKLATGPVSKEDREFASPITKLLESGHLYYSVHCDLTQAFQKRRPSSANPNAFWWTWPMASNAGSTGLNWSLRTVYGFVGSYLMRFASGALSSGSGDFQYTLISRRSRRRAGTRYITRGVDALGDVANFVETEQVVWRGSRPKVFSSFIIIRGSVPVFWRQNNGIARPSPELDSDLNASRKAFNAHFKKTTKSYGEISVVSLVDKMGSEGVLAYALERHFDLDLRGAPAKLVAFDFHRHCAGKEYERGLAALLSRIRDDITRYSFCTQGLGFQNRQTGVFRVNCVDCLDRTNVVQSIIARVALSKQLSAIYTADAGVAMSDVTFRLYGDSEDRFKHVWGDNADAVSRQYSGTGALKTDFTRTGKRSTTGVIGDGVKSVMRMYYKNFVDEGRQESIDLLCGNAFIHPLEKAPPPAITPTPTTDSILEDFFGPPPSKPDVPPPKPKSSPVWYKFQAQRMNAGGDRQDVVVELGDSAMYLSSPDGVRVEYPRRKLVSWARNEDGKSSERRAAIRLRLIFEPTASAPAAASPLDLIFKGGVIARETFLRAVLMWASPAVAESMGRKPIRLRCMASLNLNDHKLSDWGLDGENRHSRDVVALVVPETFGSGRSPGLGAVPEDVDNSSYSLVSAISTPNAGPAIAVLVSKDLAPTVMHVSESILPKPSATSHGCGVAVSMIVGGTSVCFASLAVNGGEDLYRVLSSMRLRQSVFDITNQFHHVCVAGTMGDLNWMRTGDPDGPKSRAWVRLNDGAWCYSLPNGLSVMRNSFPGLRWDDMVDKWSYWRDSVNESNGSRSHISILSDGITDGFDAPSVPQSMTQYVATVSKLEGKDVRTPPNVDPNIPLITYVNIYSDYASTDSLGTRPIARPTSTPKWLDNIRLVFLPATKEEIMSSFLLGQIVINNALSDTLVAGHFVIPMSVAGDGGAAFDVPLRLAGISTGRLKGFLHVMPLNEGVEGASMTASNTAEAQPRNSSTLETSFAAVTTITSASNRTTNRPAYADISSLPRPSRVESPTNSSSSLGTVAPAGSYSSYMSSGLPNRMSANEVNDKLDAARRKSSKQIKSMMGKISSMMNTSTGSDARPQAPSSQNANRSRIFDDPPTWDGQH